LGAYGKSVPKTKSLSPEDRRSGARASAPGAGSSGGKGACPSTHACPSTDQSSRHLMEHPMDGTGSKSMVRPSRVASMARRRSWRLTLRGSFQLSSKRPL